LQVGQLGLQETLCPVKADAHTRTTLGSATVLTPVRRSMRQSLRHAASPSLTEQLEVHGG